MALMDITLFVGKVVCTSSEFDCKNAGCLYLEAINCRVGTCISESSINNGFKDCVDGSDEKGT